MPTKKVLATRDEIGPVGPESQRRVVVLAAGWTSLDRITYEIDSRLSPRPFFQGACLTAQRSTAQKDIHGFDQGVAYITMDGASRTSQVPCEGLHTLLFTLWKVADFPVIDISKP